METCYCIIENDTIKESCSIHQKWLNDQLVLCKNYHKIKDTCTEIVNIKTFRYEQHEQLNIENVINLMSFIISTFKKHDIDFIFKYDAYNNKLFTNIDNKDIDEMLDDINLPRIFIIGLITLNKLPNRLFEHV